MLLLRLTCCCFLVSFVESRGIASEPGTSLQLHDKGITTQEIENHYEIKGGKNLGHWLVAVERVNPSLTFERKSEIEADKAKTEKNVEKMTKMKVESVVKVRSEHYAETETKAVEQVLQDAERPNLKRRPCVNNVSTSKKNTQLQYEAIKYKATDTETKVKDKTGSKLGAKKERETKFEVEIKTLPEFSTEFNNILRSDLTSNEEAILQAKRGSGRVPVLQTRGFQESLSEAFNQSTSRLLKPGGLVDVGMRTAQPYVEWLKTVCRYLPMNYGMLMSAYRRLKSLGGGSGNKPGTGTATPKSKRRKIKPADLGLKTFVDGQIIGIERESNEDGVVIPATYEGLETRKTPPESPQKSPKKLPPTSLKESPSKVKKGGIEGGVLGGESEDFAGVGGDLSAPKMPAQSQQKSPPKSQPAAMRTSPPKRRKSENGSGVSDGESDGVFKGKKDIREQITQTEPGRESPKKSPEKDKRGVNGGQVGGNVSRPRFTLFDRKRLNELRDSFKARRREAGLPSDDEADRPRLSLSSDQFDNEQVNFPDDWKLLEKQYGKQKG